jgi:DNA invertase Pin-like site-specific DNA recombinase
MEKKVRCAIYVRCSTADQSTAMQLADLRVYLSNRGWNASSVYEDIATGTNTNRPKFQQMMKDARGKKFDILLVWKLDRFARSLKDLVTHLQELTELGVAFVSLKDQLDLGTSMGRLMLHIVGAFSEFEASIIKERVTAGVRAKIARTGRWGRHRIRDDQAVHALRKKGLSVREIAKKLGVSPTSVMRSIKGVPFTSRKRRS